MSAASAEVDARGASKSSSFNVLEPIATGGHKVLILVTREERTFDPELALLADLGAV